MVEGQTFAPVLDDAGSLVGRMLRLGMQAILEGDLSKARVWLRRCVDDPEAPAEAWTALGSVLAESGDWGGAVTVLRRSIVLHPACGKCYSLLGRLLFRLVVLREALRQGLRAVHISKTPDACLLVGELLLDFGIPEAAEGHFRNGCTTAPDLPCLIGLGKSLKEQGRLEEAAATLELALSLRPGHVETLEPLADVLSKLGRWTELISVLNDAVATVPADSGIQFKLGRLLFSYGLERPSVDLYRRFAASQAPSSRYPNKNCHIVQIYSARALCAAHGFFYQTVLPSRPCNVPADGAGAHVFTLPEVYLACFEQGQILTTNHTVLLDHKNYVVDGLLAGTRRSQIMTPHYVWHSPDDRVLLDLPGPAVAAGVDEGILIGGAANWSHGVLDWASKLVALEGFPELERLPLLFSADMPRAILDFFNLLGIDRERIIRMGAEPLYEVGRLWVPSLTHIYQYSSPDFVAFLRRKLAPLLVPGPKRRRFFLSRRAAGYRALLNEQEILEALRPFGVEPLVPELLSMEDQIRAFADAELMIGPIGGSSASCLFAPPGCGIIELTHTRIVLPQYGILTSILGQRYRRLIGQAAGNRGPSLFDFDFRVPVDAVVAAVTSLLDGS